jgi:hypothetical protein
MATGISSSHISDYPPLSKWGRRGLIALAGIVVLFGLIVEKRSAFMQRRMTDLGVYLRVGWAVRSGEDMYDVIDDNGWHYQYPPLFAILMAPLADPPAGVDRTGFLPYAASVAIWYVFSVLCLVLSVHWLASALEEAMARPGHRPVPRGCRRWWALRVVPMVSCIVPIGHTLMRGQVNLLLMVSLCAMTAALLRGQSWRAGLWLAGAICLKVIPGFLLLIPVWRRDARCLAGCALGLVVGLLMIPATVFGLPRTMSYYREYDEKLLRPAMGTGTDQSRARELIEMTANDSQSIMSVIHNTLYPDRLKRPAKADYEVRWAHHLLGAFLTGVTVLAAGWGRAGGGTRLVLFMGALVINMLLLSPVCHLHYFCLAVPLVMGLMQSIWERDVGSGRGFLLLLGFNVVADSLPHFQGLEPFRDMGCAMYAALLLWGAGCLAMWKLRKSRRVSDSAVEVSAAA